MPAVMVYNKKKKSSGTTALQGLGQQSGRRRSAKLVPTFADRGVSRGQRNGSPRPFRKNIVRKFFLEFVVQFFLEYLNFNFVINTECWKNEQEYCESERTAKTPHTIMYY